MVGTAQVRLCPPYDSYPSPANSGDDFTRTISI